MRPRIGDLAIADFDGYINEDHNVAKALCILTGYVNKRVGNKTERWSYFTYWESIDGHFRIHERELPDDHLVRVYPKHHTWHGGLRELELDDVSEYKGECWSSR